MVVYGDVLFVLNLALDYALLLVTARIAACPFVRLRLLGGAVFGAGYALAVFLPGCAFLSAWPIRLAAGLVMVMIAYGGERRLGYILLVFAACTAALGGGVLALTGLGSATFYKGVAATGADLAAVLIAGGVGLAGLCLAVRRRGPGLGRQKYAEIGAELNGRKTAFLALVDTGNTLTDRNNRGVIVADWQVVSRLLPPGAALREREVRTPALGFQRLAEFLEPGQVRLLSYRTVGLPDGLLLALRPDEVTVDGERRPGLLLAASPAPVADGGGYQGLIGPEGMKEQRTG
ncbi:MAG: sigma-E processing peptidase SpoIIGA, partial [Clostridia bacterium]|nr:sigma-E processing peptidase SpoIIGA [Clostridia bacterium]